MTSQQNEDHLFNFNLISLYIGILLISISSRVALLAPAVTVGETEGAMDSTSVFFCLFFSL